MKKSGLRRASCFLIPIISILLSPVVYGDDHHEIPSFYPLIQRLSGDGFDPEFLCKLFADPRMEFVPVVTTISRYATESPGRYIRFMNPESVLISKHFLRKNHTILRQMEKRFNVEKEVAVAILLVESRFGENIGRHRVIPTLASMALMDSPENLRENFLILQQNDPELPYEWMEALAKKKAGWAYQELKCFLNIIREEKIDPLEVYGSTAGAMGMAQFVPSSYLNYALRKRSFQ